MKPLKVREIEIYPKNTTASTIYYDMDGRDEEYLYRWMYRLMADMQEYLTQDEQLCKEWFRRRPRQFPKGQFGPNSQGSMLGGLCSAKLANPNKNLSQPQLDAVEYFFNLIAHFYAHEEDPPQAIRFRKRLYEIQD